MIQYPVMVVNLTLVVRLTNHYSLLFQDVFPPFEIRMQMVIIDDSKYRYNVYQTKDLTIIRTFDIDAEGRIIDSAKSIVSLPITFQRPLFDFQKTNRDNILHRIRTIQTLR